MNTAHKFRLTKILLLVAMMVALVASLAVVTSAADGTVTVEKIVISGLTEDNGVWTKTYDGTDTIDPSKFTVTAGSIATGDNVTLEVESAKFDSKNAAEASYITVTFKLTGADAGSYTAPAPMKLPAKILPVELSWAAGSNATASAIYNPDSVKYAGLTVGGTYTLNTAGVVSGETVTVNNVGTVSVDAVAVTGSTPITAYAGVELSSTNYTVPALPVAVSINPVEITEIFWNETGYSYTWGDAGIYEIEAYGKDAAGNEYPLAVVVQNGSSFYTLSEAARNGLYGQVKANETATRYTVMVQPTNGNYTIASTTVDQTREVSIARKYYTVTLNNLTVPAELEISGTTLKPMLQKLLVNGTDIPTDLLAAIAYQYKDASGKTLTTAGASDAGVYTVVATLPGASDGDSFCNYGFKNASGEIVTSLQGTLTIERSMIVLGTDDMPYQMFIVGNTTLSSGVTATLTVPEELNRSALRGFHIHQEYTLTLSGLAAGEKVDVVIPVSDIFFSNPNAAALTDADLYVYDGATGTMASAKNTYTVKLSDDSSYYIISGFSVGGEITFVIAPEYDAPFWVTAPGIALIILLVLAVLVILFFIGLKLRQIERSGKNPVMVIDTEGEVPEVVPVVIPDKIEDADACLEESIDELAEALAEEVEADSEEMGDVDASEAVSESLDELLAEAAEIDLTEEPEDHSETDEMLDAMAAEAAEGLQDIVDAESADADADEDLVKASVAEAMEENFNESADSTDAILLVADVEESDEMDPEAFRLAVDAIVSDALANTLVVPSVEPEEVTEEVAEETAEEVAEETAEEVVEETAEEVVEETAEEVAEETAEEVVEETAEEVVEETVEEATEEVAEETVEEMNVCAIVADSVAEAFEVLAADGIEAKAVEGTTKESITEAVNVAAAENAPETWSEELTAEVKTAVVEELAARLLVEEAVEAIAVVTEESEDDDNDDDENDFFGGFAGMDLDYIDVIAEADRYAEMLEQEARGEVQLVTRYRRSFQSRLVQSQGNVQDYYNVIKNLLLSYKGVKNRISWNYESFNLGRTQLAKFNAKTRTLYVYIALDPTELVDTKYGIVDVSSKKKYAAVPVLMKVKGDRKFKYTVELITRLCEEQLQLPKKKVVEEIDYRVDHKPTEDLVAEGLVKKLVAAIPVSLLQPAEETDVTMVPAEETPVEETPVEEVPVVEASVEEAPAVEASAEAEVAEGTPEETV